MGKIIQIEIAIEIENNDRADWFDPDFDGDLDFEKYVSGIIES